MTEIVLHRFNGITILQGKNCKGVSEIVNTAFRRSNLFRKLLVEGGFARTAQVYEKTGLDAWESVTNGLISAEDDSEE